MSNLIKYTRIPYVPFSPLISKGDRVLDNLNHFIGKNIIVAEKMDGENTSLYRDEFFMPGHLILGTILQEIG